MFLVLPNPSPPIGPHTFEYINSPPALEGVVNGYYIDDASNFCIVLFYIYISGSVAPRNSPSPTAIPPESVPLSSGNVYDT